MVNVEPKVTAVKMMHTANLLKTTADKKQVSFRGLAGEVVYFDNEEDLKAALETSVIIDEKKVKACKLVEK